MSVFMPVSALSLVFLFRSTINFFIEKLSENNLMIYVVAFSVLSLVYVFGMAIWIDRLKKKYFADERYWPPEVLEIPTDCKSVDFLKNKLRQQDFTTFSVRQGEQWYDYTVVYCKKYKYIEPVCLTFIDGDKIQEDYNDYLRNLSESIRENSACKELKIYNSSILIPIIYTNNPHKFKGLTKESLYGGGFWVFPCIMDASSNKLFVTKTVFYGARYRTKKTNMVAVNVISGILNSTDNAV